MKRFTLTYTDGGPQTKAWFTEDQFAAYVPTLRHLERGESVTITVDDTPEDGNNPVTGIAYNH